MGVGLGVASLIIVLGVMTGFSENLRDKILGINAHVIVGSLDKGFGNYTQLVDKAKGIKGVKSATPSSTPRSSSALRGVPKERSSAVLILYQQVQS